MRHTTARVSLRIGETGEYWKVTGELLWKGKALSGNKQNLAGEFCVVSGEFSDLQCLMNTLLLEWPCEELAINYSSREESRHTSSVLSLSCGNWQNLPPQAAVLTTCNHLKVY